MGYSPWGRRESDKIEQLTLSLYFQKERSITERGWDRQEGYLYVCVYIYIYMCVCVYVCIYIYIYIYVYLLETDKSELEKNLKFLKSIF